MTQKKEFADWGSIAKKTHKDLFSELDVLLRAADRFFNIENLPSEKESLTDSNFFDELSAVRDLTQRVISILEIVIPESKRNAYWFQKFAETKFFTDHKRDALKEELYKQDTPEKGIFLLYDSFISLKGLVGDLLKTGHITYLSYLNIGQIVSKEIRENSHFNPFKKEINPEFDIIDNQHISETVKDIKDKETKKHVSMLLVYLFRFLRYLNHINTTTQKTIALNTSLMILMLMRSEIEMFKKTLEKSLSKITQADLQMLLRSISYQFSMESKRIYLQELKDLLKKRAPRYFRGRIENSHGILKNVTEQSIVQIAQYFKPDLKGDDIFSSFMAKSEQSLRLREDIFVLSEFLALFVQNAGIPEERLHIFESLKNFMSYFESFTFRLLRHDDYEEFFSFFRNIVSIKKEQVASGDIGKLIEDIHNFRIFLGTTLRQIEGRGELTGKPIDTNRVDKIMRQYLTKS